MASFVQTSDPNAHKATNASVAGVPRIDEGRQFIVKADNERLAQGGINRLENRCDFWLMVAGNVPI